MANKKCIYCGETMARVILGMPTQDEAENPRPLVEYAGCIMGPMTPKWRCQYCGYEVLPLSNPSSGICINEAPDRVKRALTGLIGRISEFAVPADEMEQLIELVCPIQYSSPPDEEALQEHKLHGDHINVHICGCNQIKIHLDGKVIVTTLKSEGLYHGHLEETTEVHADFLPSFRSLPKRIQELFFGNSLFEELIYLIGFQAGTGCVKDGEHTVSTGDWGILINYWEQQEFDIPPEAQRWF